MVTVFITGASRGIGLALVRRFLERGAQVIAACRGEPSPALAALSVSPALTLVELDVADEGSIASLADQVTFKPVDLLINNAGVLGPLKQDAADVDMATWLQVFAVNSIAPSLVSRALLPHLKLSSQPKILTISSEMGSFSSQSAGMLMYRSSKAAVNKAMQVLARELASDNIMVCSVHPGWVRTDMGGQGADISVEESADGIVQLAERLTIAETGRFYNWRGDALAW